ncbi:MAG: CpaF family protein [Firmicutes bacterium]|nr:CpaF family protein [Bacillota bacterium]
MLSARPEAGASVEQAAAAVRRRMNSMGKELSDGEVEELCEDEVFSSGRHYGLSFGERARLAHLAFCTLRCELEIIQDYADDPEVTEIMVNGCDGIFVERGSESFRADRCFESPARLEQVIRRLAARVGREMNDLNPIVDARLSDGSRVNAVHSNVAIGGPILTIRKFTSSRLTMDELVAKGDISREASELLKLLVECAYSVFVCGGTSSGKTTFLNVLSDHIPPRERVIVIEDSAELKIRGHENLVRLEAKSANAQGKGAVSIRDLIRSSLRMRPDRIIVGEVRGAEVIDMLAAMSTGHDGSLSTGHANSPAGMLGRLETMALSGGEYPADAIRGQIAEAIEIIVHLARTQDGRRRVMRICELDGYRDGAFALSDLYRFDPARGELVRVSKLKKTDKLAMKGRIDGLLEIYSEPR